MTTSLVAAACCCGPCGGFEVGTTYHNALCNGQIVFVAPPVIGYAASSANGVPIKYPSTGTAAWTLPCFSVYSWTSTLYQNAASPGQNAWNNLPAIVVAGGNTLFCHNDSPLQVWFVPGPAPGVPVAGRWFGLWRGNCTYNGVGGFAPAGVMATGGFIVYSWLGSVGSWPVPIGTNMLFIGQGGSQSFQVCNGGVLMKSQTAQQTTSQCGTGFLASMEILV
jgi:hypothetical protein